jgi:hypothetical protein
MRGAILPLPQYDFVEWCLVKAEGRLYLILPIRNRCLCIFFEYSQRKIILNKSLYILIRSIFHVKFQIIRHLKQELYLTNTNENEIC